MKFKHFISIIWFVLIINAVGVLISQARCSDAASPLASLIRVSEQDDNKIPLILIHGIHGTGNDKDVTVKQDYWDKFINNQFEELNSIYELYIFQYCSDRKPVFPDISNEFGNAVEIKLNGRPHAIVAHSMGGLVAKSYMVFYKFRTGKLSGKLGGDAVFGKITLATPHHGTPGANAFDILEPYTKFGWENSVQLGLKQYWKRSGVSNSFVANRSDLRWDNFDNSFDKIPVKLDDNLWLSQANLKFERFYNKTIAYAGYLKPSDKWLISNIASKLPKANYQELLEIANELLIKGFGGRFGTTDGLVPFKSGLFCTNDPIISKLNSNAICNSQLRVRRFEPGIKNEAEDLPFHTLSLSRNGDRGYDHEEMYKNNDVLNWVVFDLKNSFKLPLQPIELPPPINFPTSPTLFLFDVSGSMNERNKIDQAKVAGLDALREIRNSSTLTTSVSIQTFSGECNNNSTKNLLDFTTNFTDAENTMSNRIPKPDGGTPLPQALEYSQNSMANYLFANRLKEGRIILLSDGESTCGDVRPAGIYSRANNLQLRSDYKVRLLTIGFDVPAGSSAERDLQYLADVSGGKYFNAADRRQLIRAFQKLIRVYIPKSSRFASNSDFACGINAFVRFDYLAALRCFKSYTQTNNTDPFGWYNLALAYEALDRYKAATECYRKYLSLFPNAPDRVQIETRIARMQQDRIDLFNYYIAVIQSDSDYLKRYYKSIFNRSNRDLAVEFNGFVREKNEFYKNLSDILEINERWLTNDSKDLSDSIETLAERSKSATFDRDAVSLLTISIGQIEEMLERLNEFGNKNIQ